MDLDVAVEDLRTKQRKTLNTNGIFVFVGFDPNLSFINENIARDSRGYLVTDEHMQTDISDVYAVGDVRTKSFRQITTAVSDGTIAAIAGAASLGI